METERTAEAQPTDLELSSEHDKGHASIVATDTYASKLQEIERRALAAKLTVGRFKRPVGTPSGPVDRMLVHFDDERRRDSIIHIRDTEDADELLGLPFEEYRMVPRYAAIFKPATGEIEARVRRLDRLIGLPPARPPFDKPYELNGYPRHPGKTIEIGHTMGLGSVLFGDRRSRRLGRTSGPAIRFHGFSASTPTAAKLVLDEVGSALMFELDLAYGVPCEIPVAGEVLPRRLPARVRSNEPPSFPRNAYDPEPVALYMHAREARGMPLLRFLAYYQAIEFYFPRYSDAELRRQLETIIKHPTFNHHRDRDIQQLLNVALGDGRRGVRSERDQLKDTIRACMQASEIAEFVGSDSDRMKFFSDRRSPLTRCTISLQDQTTDLRDAVANRIYDLRCKVVHTKDGPGQNEIDLLLPNSPEAELLHDDVGLLDLITKRVIVSSSRELTT